jgi:hypothetical protein
LAQNRHIRLSIFSIPFHAPWVGGKRRPYTET